MTFGVLYESRAHRRSKGFIDRIPPTFEQVERSEGFIARSDLDTTTGLHSWGELVCPKFLAEDLHPHVARTLTLWHTLESVCAFVYAGLHAEAVKLRKEWFREVDYPNHVIWWVADDHRPTFIESTARLEQLYAEGPGPEAFSFKRTFDAKGNKKPMNHKLTQEIAARNARQT